MFFSLKTFSSLEVSLISLKWPLRQITGEKVTSLETLRPPHPETQLHNSFEIAFELTIYVQRKISFFGNGMGSLQSTALTVCLYRRNKNLSVLEHAIDSLAGAVLCVWCNVCDVCGFVSIFKIHRRFLE